MDKQFEEFKAYVPENFKDLMIQYWMRDENMSRDEAIDAYLDDDFEKLNKRIANTYQTFKPDLGYVNASELEGGLCFEVDDNNIVIPVDILEEKYNPKLTTRTKRQRSESCVAHCYLARGFIGG